MLDGIRCTYKANLGKFFSRKRNEFHLPHLQAQMGILGISVDGELWHPDWSLEDIISVVKGDDEERKKELQYWIFDRPQGGTYVERMAQAMEIRTTFLGSPLELEARITGVFAKQDGEWRLVQFHYSIPISEALRIGT